MACIQPCTWLLFFSFSLPLLLASPLQDDVACLKAFKASVSDPSRLLSSWQFSGKKPAGYICSFNGITCWHDGENKVFSLKLSHAGIAGKFPVGLSGCKSLQQLDLSSNNLSGLIPPNLCSQLAYLTSLDLSRNNFAGSIPESLGDCIYLNQLHLSQNQLTGRIPWQLTRLQRLSDLDLSDNKLSGPIPTFHQNFSPTSFVNNPMLCGPPLRKSCSASSSHKTEYVGVAVGTAAAALFFVSFLAWWLLPRRTVKSVLRDEHKWAKRITAPKSVNVSMFEKPMAKLRLSDLMAATKDFSKDNILASGKSGTMYRANLADGSVLAIKRLCISAQSDKQFKAEMNTLGQVNHRNLVPLLGYCIAEGEKLLIYKHMSNGCLRDCLHNAGAEVKLDWPTRLKIGIGAARGLAWLHHSCNPRIIHRNISAASILLDEEYEPRIADFGLARLMNPVDTHISTYVNGDFGDAGYVAPEYIRTLMATLKGDAYSFGVVLLELVTSQKANDVQGDPNFKGNLAEWIAYLPKNCLEKAIDKSLKGKGFDDELLQFLSVGCACILARPKERPTMYEVYHLLRPIGEKYGFLDQNDEIPLTESIQDTDQPSVSGES